MTSVPKPLKFLRPHYDTLKTVYEKIKDKETQVSEKVHVRWILKVNADKLV